MAGGSGAPTAAPNPFGPQSTPMGGGSSPLNTGGGFSGGFGGGQTAGTMGGFGGNLGTAGMGGQQMPNAGSQFNAAQNPGANRSNVPDWVQAPEPGMMTSSALTELTNPATGEKFMAPSGGYSVRQPQPTQNSGSLLMRPENPIPYTGPTDPSQFLNKIAGLSDRLARQQQQPQQPMSFEQFQNQPRYPEMAAPTQADYQSYLSGPSGMQVAPPSYMQRRYAQPGQDFRDVTQSQIAQQQQIQQAQDAYQQFQQQQYNPYQRQYNPYRQQQQPFNPYARQMPQQMPFNKGMPYRQPAYDPNNMLAGEQNYYNRMAQQRQSRQNPYSMTMDMPQQQRSQGLAGLLAAFPQNFGREQRYTNPSNFANYSGVRPAAAAIAAPAAPAVEASPAVYDPGYQISSW